MSNVRGGHRRCANAPQPGQKGWQAQDVPLTEAERQQVARWLGEFQPPNTIPALIAQTFGKQVDQTYAYSLLRRGSWTALIDRYRQEWMVGTLKVPLANRRYRLERLQQQLTQLDAQAQRGQIAASRYQSRLLALLDRARREMDQPKEGETNYFFTNINSASDEELLARRAMLVKRIEAFRLPLRRREPHEDPRITPGMGDGVQSVETALDTPATIEGRGDIVGQLEDDRAEAGPPAG